MKKILIIAAKLNIGGAEKVAQDIALHADHEEYEFHYVVFGNEVGAYEHQLLEKACKVFHLAEPSVSYRKYLGDLMGLIKQHRYHAVHVHTMFSSGWVMLAAKLSGVPVRVTHAHSALDDGKSFVKSIYEAVMRFLILSCATDLVACGVKAGQRLYGSRAYEKRGQLVLTGIDIPGFAYSKDARGVIRKQLNAEDSFILGHVGHLADVKNQSFLLDLMPHILEKKPNALLLLLGEGENRPMLEQKIRDLKLQDHVIMTGNVTNVADYLSAMDVFVFPSLYEGLPLSILEVQANGLPCVISDRVPEDVFLTDLIHPLSLEDPKEAWIKKILSAKRSQPQTYNDCLRGSAYAVETAMEKIYCIYEKGQVND